MYIRSKCLMKMFNINDKEKYFRFFVFFFNFHIKNTNRETKYDFNTYKCIYCKHVHFTEINYKQRLCQKQQITKLMRTRKLF